MVQDGGIPYGAGRVYQGGYMAGYTRMGIWPGIHPWVYSPVYTPWVHLHTSWRDCSVHRAPMGSWWGSGEALGSCFTIIMVYSRVFTVIS